MRCVECDTADVSERPERTTQGYQRFPCRAGSVTASGHSARVAAWDQHSQDRRWGLFAMDCVGCSAPAVTEQPSLTAQGYRRFRCRNCDTQFNERSDGVLNRASLPSDIIAIVVFCRLRYRLKLRDLSEIMLLRGFTISHECIREWEAKLLPVMGDALRKRRHGAARISGESWSPRSDPTRHAPGGFATAPFQ